MRIIKPKNTLNRSPRYLFAFDTETTTTIYDKRLKRLVWRLGCGIFHDRKTGEQRTIKTTHRLEFLGFMLSCVPKNGTLWVYAHNLYFDFKVVGLNVLLPKLGWELEWFYFASGGGNAIMIFKKGRRKIKFVNSYNYWPMKLEKIGKAVGLEKMDVDFETADDKTLMPYCFRDTEIVMQAMLLTHSLAESQLGVSLGLTSGSTSLTAWANHQSGDWLEFHDIPELIKWERQAYKGGRCEAFFIGRAKERVSCLDVNSMYPYVMSEFPMPVRVIKVWGVKPEFEQMITGTWKTHLARWITDDGKQFISRKTGDRVGVMAECTLFTNEPAIPVIKENKLVFPVGSFNATLTCCEFEYAYRRGWIKDIHSASLWVLGYPLKSYIDKIWALRHHFQSIENHSVATVLKLFGNSLYGKFAQLKIIEDHIESCDPELLSSTPWIHNDQKGVIWELCGKRIFMLNTKEATNKTHFAIAGEITARARLHLWQFALKAGLENVYYCDTDSLFVNDKGLANCKDNISDQLGDLKLEWQDTELEINGLKDYKTSSLCKIKGIRKDAEFIEQLDKWRQTQFVGFRGDLSLQNDIGIITKNISKHLNRNYNKGVIQTDGRVRPFNLVESNQKETTTQQKVV